MLSQCTGQIIHALLTRSPLRYSRLPPKGSSANTSARLACLRHAASVHPEPGSNSQVYFSYLIVFTLNWQTIWCHMIYRQVISFICNPLWKHKFRGFDSCFRLSTHPYRHVFNFLAESFEIAQSFMIMIIHLMNAHYLNAHYHDNFTTSGFFRSTHESFNPFMNLDSKESFSHYQRGYINSALRVPIFSWLFCFQGAGFKLDWLML